MKTQDPNIAIEKLHKFCRFCPRFLRMFFVFRFRRHFSFHKFTSIIYEKRLFKKCITNELWRKTCVVRDVPIHSVLFALVNASAILQEASGAKHIRNGWKNAWQSGHSGVNAHSKQHSTYPKHAGVPDEDALGRRLSFSKPLQQQRAQITF